ncbi:SP_1767 family glycosyltransferase [Streptococcus sp. NLN64]|uniref:SP_1767 family glycosyltransferase n=1 Tax=Streptococcus sp. NLN64 TaxID=2822799 RepID=UPI0018CA462B|nr:SP_1767 family glycosyltransferase [Streptococcus sp. NLN64]MBG9366828.1 SP_1767 family glycosyltransferase [Streptococcus sp. NLN64]
MVALQDIRVRPILESLEFIQAHNPSVARFGDGEVDLMTGSSIPYQEYDPDLAQALLEILETPSGPDLLVCLPDVFDNRERYNQNAVHFWKQHFNRYQAFYEEHCQSPWYGSTFISRPYIDLLDKGQAAASFAALKDLWKGRDLLIVEGEMSRSGAGNDLFAGAASLQRIICPSRHAFRHYESILETILAHAENRLILLMLGPTAKVLARDLQERGHQAIDLGHIDSEYEWFQMGVQHKVKLGHKHTAEFNYDEGIELEEDGVYASQVVARIGLERKKEGLMQEQTVEKDTQEGLISIIIPVYNVSSYLRRCMDSILKQTYRHFEVILVNDGSTDGSALICQDYVTQDSRVRLIHQENQGPSAARNRGLQVAQGEYVTFIDSDDFVEDTYLELLYRSLVKNDSEISICNFTSFNEERQAFLFSITSEMYFEEAYTVQEWLRKESSGANNLHLVFTFSPMKLFKRSLWDGLQYPVGRLREDDATIYKVYLKAQRISFINQPLYYYSQSPAGLSRNGMQEDITSMISIAEERLALLVALGYDVTEHLESYVKRLEKCQADALYSGQVELFQQISNKLDLIRHHRKEG